jgi:hypothetical protein
MMDLEIKLPENRIREVLGALRLSEPALLRAARRAVSKTARWAQGEEGRKLSSNLRIPRDVILARLRRFSRNGGLVQKLWMGLNPVEAERLGTTYRSGSGVRAGRFFFDKAFIIRRFGGKAFRRTTPEREPIERVKLDIDILGKNVMHTSERLIESRFILFMQQEAQIELQRLIEGIK